MRRNTCSEINARVFLAVRGLTTNRVLQNGPQPNKKKELMGPIKKIDPVLAWGWSNLSSIGAMLLPILFFVATVSLTAQNTLLTGIVDIHAHSDPDSLPRSIDALTLTRLMALKGFGGVVLKNHYESTAGLAWLAGQQAPGLTIFGGIALNRTVGGINSAAVERMTMVKGGRGKVVWMPTFDAENQVKYSKEARPYVPISKDGKLINDVLVVLDLIAKNDLVLATGHSSPAETKLLLAAAVQRGVKHMVVTHPVIAPVLMSVDDMKWCAAQGAYLEFVSNAIVGTQTNMTPKQFVEAIHAVGTQHVVLSSDLGQAANPIHTEGWLELFRLLEKEGLTAPQIEAMAKKNPATLLGIN